MAAEHNYPTNTNFLSPIGFKFTCTAVPNVEFFCQSANVPGVSLSAVEVPTPFKPHYVAGDRLEYEELTIRIMVDEDMKNWFEIYNWIKGLTAPDDFTQYAEQEKKGLSTSGVLTILTSSNTVNLEFHFEGMFPMSITGLQFDIGATDLTYLTADISFRYNSYKIKNILNN